METVAINGNLKSDTGKKAGKAIRKAGLIPCVIYGAGKNVQFTTTFKDIKSLIYTPDFKLADITIDGEVYKCILKAYQPHPVTESIVHIDFMQLAEGRNVKVEVPVRFTGSAPGVKVGGKIQQKIRRIKIKTTPENLVDEVALDVSNLELGQSIRVRDIAPIKGVEVMNSPGIPVATIEIPRALRSAGVDATDEEGEGEGEVEE